MTNRLITWLDNMGRQLDIDRAPKDIAIEMPTDKQTFWEDLSKIRGSILWGEDKGGFSGTVLKWNDRKYFILESKIDY